jgi:hypothetical protein
VYEEKKRKYAELARELSILRKEEGQVIAVIAPPIGGVYKKSLEDLQRVLGCRDQ